MPFNRLERLERPRQSVSEGGGWNDWNSKAFGFTLIELLVTLFIITVLTGASVPLLRQYQRTNELKLTAYDIRSAILEAKNYTLAPRASGTQIDSYAIVFYGKDYTDESKRNSYEILECQGSKPDSPTCEGGTKVLVVGSTRRLPKDVQFGAFNWNNNSTSSAELRFSVTKQGEIITTFNPSTVSPAQIIIKRGTETFTVEVGKVTGVINVKQI